MTGAWISGGIEWNFPTGHRPSCFSPISYRLAENPDGSKTIWVAETDKANDMLAKAKILDPLIERDALIFAQVTFAGAHQ